MSRKGSSTAAARLPRTTRGAKSRADDVGHELDGLQVAVPGHGLQEHPLLGAPHEVHVEDEVAQRVDDHACPRPDRPPRRPAPSAGARRRPGRRLPRPSPGRPCAGWPPACGCTASPSGSRRPAGRPPDAASRCRAARARRAARSSGPVRGRHVDPVRPGAPATGCRGLADGVGRQHADPDPVDLDDRRPPRLGQRAPGSDRLDAHVAHGADGLYQRSRPPVADVVVRQRQHVDAGQVAALRRRARSAANESPPWVGLPSRDSVASKFAIVTSARGQSLGRRAQRRGEVPLGRHRRPDTPPQHHVPHDGHGDHSAGWLPGVVSR